MVYVIIETMPLGLVQEDDKVAVFDSMEEAEKAADDCQRPIIVEIGDTYFQ